jgi:hypothetical protein
MATSAEIFQMNCQYGNSFTFKPGNKNFHAAKGKKILVGSPAGCRVKDGRAMASNTPRPQSEIVGTRQGF